MSQAFSRRRLLQLSACVGAGFACPALAQSIHAPEAGLDRWHRAVCGQCGLVDTLFAGHRGTEIAALKGDPLGATALGRLCTRGMALPSALQPGRRPTTPLLRRDAATKGSGGGLEPVSWEEAGAWLAQRFGPLFAARKAAALLDADLPCETQFDANRLFKGFLGCAHVDSSLRLDGAAGLRAAELSTGLPGPTGTTSDVDGADLFLIVGANPAERHATLFYRMAQCQRQNGTRTVVIDPRRTLSCGLADVLGRPTVPGTDGAILRAIAHILLREGFEADLALENLDAFVETARQMSPLRAAQLSGAGQTDIEAAAEAFSSASRPFSVFGRGLMRGGARAVRTLFDLHLFRGRLADGATVLPLLEGANGSGAWLMGSPTERLPGLRMISDPAARADIAELWGCDAAGIPSAPGLRLGEWLPGLETGALGGVLWIGGNPLPRLPANSRWRSALADTLAVHATPVHPTETSAWADLVLPMALPWLEERGVFISCDRRVQLTAPGSRPQGLLSSLDLVARIAGALTAQLPHRWPATTDPEEVWETCRRSSRGSVCDLSGMTYPVLTDVPGLSWPHPEGASSPADPRAVPAHLRAPEPRLSHDSGAPGLADGTEPSLRLFPIATAHHTACRELTGFVPELHYASPRAWIEVNGRDATTRGLRDGAFVAVESAAGVLAARLWITDRVPRGLVAIPDHFGFVSDLEGGTDGRGEPPSLTASVVPLVADPDSGQLGVPSVPVTLREPTAAELATRVLRRS